MTTPPDPYAPRDRPHQPPLTPYTPPTEDAPQPGSDAGTGWAPPSGAGGQSPPSPYGAQPSPYGTPAPYGTPLSPYGAQPSPYGTPPGGPPPSPYGPAGSYSGYPVPYAPPTPTNGLAVASMIVSVASLVLCIGLPGIVGLVLGIVALNQVLRDGKKGKGFAIAGIAVGAVGTILLMLFLIGLAMDA
ncbi:DUF4190 domain-containing protein [Cellulosimicrobium terreum]|nr:DUF4190 domain-containing protein [Cellulosimicrobium terreum]